MLGVGEGDGDGAAVEDLTEQAGHRDRRHGADQGRDPEQAAGVERVDLDAGGEGVEEADRDEDDGRQQ